MQSSRFQAYVGSLCLAASTMCLTSLAAADAADDLTAKGEVNVNDQRALPIA